MIEPYYKRRDKTYLTEKIRITLRKRSKFPIGIGKQWSTHSS